MQTNRHTEDCAIQTGFDWITAYIIRLPGKSTAEGISQRQPVSLQWAGWGTSISGRFSKGSLTPGRVTAHVTSSVSLTVVADYCLSKGRHSTHCQKFTMICLIRGAPQQTCWSVADRAACTSVDTLGKHIVNIKAATCFLCFKSWLKCCSEESFQGWFYSPWICKMCS